MWNNVTIPDQIQIGYYYTFCCHMDLAPIEDAEDLQYIRQVMVSEERPSVTVWESKIAALTDMVHGYAGTNPHHIAECKSLLRAAMKESGHATL